MLLIPSPLERILLPFKNNITLYIKRDDLIHSHISGNKWRKLIYNIEAFQQQNKKILVTVGGAFSNHIMATAAVSNWKKIPCIGIIRGDELNIHSNKNLAYAHQQNMHLEFIDRHFYAKRYDDDFLELLSNKLDIPNQDIFFIPEGGANMEGAKGCEDIVHEIDLNFDYILTDCGTGTTLAGIANAVHENQKAIGISVIGNNFDIEQSTRHFTNKPFTMLHQFNFGGYAKTNTELLDFIKYFYRMFQIKLDYVYTAKLFYAIFNLIEQDYFPPNSTIIGVHTGGVLNADIFDEI